MKNFKLEQIAQQSNSLFNETKALFTKSSNKTIKSLVQKVPSSFVDKEKPITVVFAGQYSAGKSTILSLLTGEKLVTGAGVTTAEVKEINWNGITVIDTPGIHTQKHPDHDEITYDAIAKADLIIFVVTAEGFSSHLAEHFKKLLFEKQKGNEMMLVVNKMDKTQMGNTKEQQDIVFTKNILPVIAPQYTGDDLYVSFIDASLYQESLAETNDSFKSELARQSGFETFIDRINKFVTDKGLLGRCTTNLFRLEQLLIDAQREFSLGDKDMDMTKHLLTRQRSILNESRGKVTDTAYNIVRKHTRPIPQWGNEIANGLSSTDKESEINSALQKKYDEVNKIPDTISTDIASMLNEESERLQKSFEDLQNTEFGRVCMDAIKDRINKADAKDVQSASKIAKGANDFGQLLSKWSTGPNAQSGWQSLFKLGNFSHSGAHDAVLKVGHFFGHKFKPWEAVKWTRGIGVAGKAVGVVGAIGGIFIQYYGDKQEKKVEDQLRDARSSIRSKFDEVANVIDMKFDEETQTWVEENLGSKISDIDGKLKELSDLAQNQDIESKQYASLLERTRLVIKDIQSNCSLQ